MRTPWLPAVDWTDAPANLNGLVCFVERWNRVSVRVPSNIKRSLQLVLPYLVPWTLLLVLTHLLLYGVDHSDWPLLVHDFIIIYLGSYKKSHTVPYEDMKLYLILCKYVPVKNEQTYCFRTMLCRPDGLYHIQVIPYPDKWSYGIPLKGDNCMSRRSPWQHWCIYTILTKNSCIQLSVNNHFPFFVAVEPVALQVLLQLPKQTVCQKV